MPKLKIKTVEVKRTGDSSHVFINGRKTNIWWWESSYRYYDKHEAEMEKFRALNFVKLIKSGEVWFDKESAEMFDNDGTTYSIDSCSHPNGFKFTEAHMIADGIDIPSKNILCMTTDYGRHREMSEREFLDKVLNEYNDSGSAHYIQWCKVLTKDYSQVLRGIGVKCGNSGYITVAVLSTL